MLWHVLVVYDPVMEDETPNQCAHSSQPPDASNSARG